MIPDNINQTHINEAIKYIDANGVPPERTSSKYDVVINGKSYPPKYLISLANKFANSIELNPSDFSGGLEANSFLNALGYSIMLKQGDVHFPLEAYTWKILSSDVFIKLMDKSVFLHHGTGIPMEITKFFGIENLGKTARQEVSLVYKGRTYKGHFIKEALGRTRLFWKSDFSQTIRSVLPDWYSFFKADTVTENPPAMRLKKNNNQYHVTFIDPNIINPFYDDEEDILPRSEGTLQHYYSRRYERNPSNRKAAIELHGLNCSVCGFNFEAYYGERGQGFIEIHHIKPLSSFDHEQIVNPATDLLPVCSNCHRMLHRVRDDVWTIEQLKTVLTWE